jgi:hypothetical protein
MVGLEIIAFGMMGLVYGLCHWILYCSGVRACPAWWSKKTKADDIIPEQAIGAMGELAAAIGLLVLALVMVWYAHAGPWSVFIGVTAALYGFLFLGTTFVAMGGWDWRPIGDAAMFGGFTAAMIITPFAALAGLPWDACLVFFIWSILAFSWGLVIHGKISAKILQANLVLSLLGAWWFIIAFSGVYVFSRTAGTWKWLSDVQTALSNTNWSIVWVVLGVVTVIMAFYSYRMGPKKWLMW